MGYLERIFLGTMVLFALGMFFIFALYFDVGDMFTGTLDKRGTISRGAAVNRLIEGIERKNRVKPDKSSDANTFSRRARAAPNFSCSRRAIRSRYDRFFPRKIKRGLKRVEQYRKILRKKGYTNEDYIEMEALAQNKEVEKGCVPPAERAMAEGRFSTAIELLEQALKEINPKNLKLRTLLLQKLTQARLLNNDLEAAQRSQDKVLALSERILNIKSQSKLIDSEEYKEEINRERKQLLERRDIQEKFFKDLQRRKEITGSWNGYLNEERAKMKAGLMKAKREGKISEKQYQEVLDQLDEGLPYRGKNRIKDRAEKVLDDER